MFVEAVDSSVGAEGGTFAGVEAVDVSADVSDCDVVADDAGDVRFLIESHPSSDVPSHLCCLLARKHAL